MTQQIDGTSSLQTLIDTLRFPDHFNRKAAVQVLRDRGEPGTTTSPQQFLDLLLTVVRNTDDVVRGAAARALATIGERVPVESLLPLLSDPDSNVRQAIFTALGKRVPQEYVLASLQDSDPKIRSNTAHLIAYRGLTVPLAPLVDLFYDEDASVRAAAIRALGERQLDDQPVELLISALSDSSVEVQKMALLVVPELGEQMPKEAIRALLDFPTSPLPFEAAKALSRIGDPDGVAFLIVRLEDKGEFARENLMIGISNGYHSE